MPISQPAAPPRKTARTSSTSPKSPSIVEAASAPLYGKSKDRAEGLKGWADIAVLGCISRGWLADAGAISQHGESVSTEVARVAEHNEPVGKVLDILSMSGPYAALMAAILPLGVQLAVNHGLIKGMVPIQGVVPKEALEANVKRDLMKMQTEALLAQHAAERELSELQASLNGAGSEVTA
jgi:hypothetical protein